MLSPELAKRIDRLVEIHRRGIYTPAEFGRVLGELVTADNLDDILDRFPPGLSGTLKEVVAFDNRRAADDECLYPEESPFEQLHGLGQYHVDVARALMPGPDRRRLSVVCLPSHEREWSLALLGSEASGFALKLSLPAEKIYGSPDPASVPVRYSEAPLPQDVAIRICDAWRKMLGRTRIPARIRGGLDGVSYHFAYSGGDAPRMAGWTWSPAHDTAPSRLVALSHRLRQYVEAGEPERLLHLDAARGIVEWFHTPARP